MVRNPNNARIWATNLLTSSTGNSHAVFFVVVVAAGLFYHSKICVRTTTGSWKGHVKSNWPFPKLLVNSELLQGPSLCWYLSVGLLSSQ